MPEPRPSQETESEFVSRYVGSEEAKKNLMAMNILY